MKLLRVTIAEDREDAEKIQRDIITMVDQFGIDAPGQPIDRHNPAPKRVELQFLCHRRGSTQQVKDAVIAFALKFGIELEQISLNILS